MTGTCRGGAGREGNGARYVPNAVFKPLAASITACIALSITAGIEKNSWATPV